VKSPVSGQVNLQGKIAIVTGGSRGIGKAICLTLAREGAKVIVCDTLPMDKTVAAIQEFERESVGMICDVSKKDEVKGVVEKTVKKFGQVDILVNNAGVMGKTGKAIEDITLEEWGATLDINLRGAFLFCQALWPIMTKQHSGKIVCIGSIAGKIGGVLANPEYCASKGGIHAMVKCLAKKGAPLGIYVNAIAPGMTRTPMLEKEPYVADGVPLGRFGEPEDIAEAALFLSSQASNYITGTVLDVNGGLLMD
jgi:3-oxoacyl-[acyl-carrier protein] reductase